VQENPSVIDLRSDALSIVKATIQVVAALFPIVNPLGSAAIFINMIGGLDSKLHNLLAQKIAIYSFFLLLGSLLFGVKVLEFFGIAIYAVQIGGGLVLTATGWSLLTQDATAAKSGQGEDDDILANAFYPYTLPVTIGPGSISVAVTLGAHLPSELKATSILFPGVIIVALTGIALICLIIYVCYRYARVVERLLGAAGTTVVMRLSSFILVCIGIQIVTTGVRAYLATFTHF
jgi:multiple antibiotic resistance protein